MRIQSVMLYVKSLSSMERFYTEILGISPRAETRGDTWLEFDTGSTRFALHAIPAHIAEQIILSVPPERARRLPTNCCSRPMI
ncbi:MAG: hypothetical protein QM757_44460 [Paludibaculum sp.]